jgi:hypothetical protein
MVSWGGCAARADVVDPGWGLGRRDTCVPASEDATSHEPDFRGVTLHPTTYLQKRKLPCSCFTAKSNSFGVFSAHRILSLLSNNLHNPRITRSHAMPHAVASPGFQAIILCGPGASFSTFTSSPKDVPKALLPVANRPMVWYPLEWCYRMGVTGESIISPPGALLTSQTSPW